MNRSFTSLLIIALAIHGYLFANVSVASNPAQTKQKSKRTIVRSKVRPQSRYVTANGIRIHYLEWGKSNATVFLLHGLYDSAEVWSSVAPLLTRGYRVIAPDRRGAGLTDKPEDGYDHGTLARDVEALIVNLNLDRVDLVGHSAGAGVGMTVAASVPERIRTLVLVDGGFWPKPSETAGPQPQAQCDRTPEECRRQSALESGMRAYDAESLYSRVNAPVLLLMALPAMPVAKEFASGLAEAKQHVSMVAKRKLRNGRVVFIKKSGHWIQSDQPKALALAIESFLKQHASNKGLQRTRNQRVSHARPVSRGRFVGAADAQR
ncbi:MAG TPA: alpha/beta hydrolase [Pyrinomonadaceae bacterium]|nr:alpha/beta hydrolase [Pyrinomonadaceae bacterium]